MIEIGSSFVDDRSSLKDWDGFIKIGDNCFIMEFCSINGHGGIIIGNDVLIGPGTMIIAADHLFENPNELIRLQGETKKGIIIQDDVWIGGNCSILDGVIIGFGSVIGAGSVVTKDIPPYSVAYGNPCKVVRMRGSRI